MTRTRLDTPPQGLRPVSGTGYQLVDPEAARRAQQGVDSAALRARIELLERENAEKRAIERQTQPPGAREDESTTFMLSEALRARNVQLEEELRMKETALTERDRKLSDERARRDSTTMKKPSIPAMLGYLATACGIIGAVFSAGVWFTSTQIKLAAAEPEAIAAQQERMETVVKTNITHLAPNVTVADHEIRIVQLETELKALRDVINERLPPRRR